jgi:hypothetical protein
MATCDVLNVVIAIGGVLGMAVIHAAFFELRRLRKKTVAASENQS